MDTQHYGSSGIICGKRSRSCSWRRHAANCKRSQTHPPPTHLYRTHDFFNSSLKCHLFRVHHPPLHRHDLDPSLQRLCARRHAAARLAAPSLAPTFAAPVALPPTVVLSPALLVIRLASAGGAGGAQDPRRLSVSTQGTGAGGSTAPASPRIPEDEVTDGAAAEDEDERAAAGGVGEAADPSRAGAAEEAAASEWSTPAPAAAPHEAPLVIRDYAFPPDDPRFEGRPLPEEEEEERERERRFRAGGGLGGGKRSSWDSEDGLVHWGFVTTHASDFPPASDLSDSSSSSPDAYAFHDPEADGGLAYGDEDGEGPELGEFVPGVYAAMYPFEPELDTEMRLEAGELVSVFERQCAGWVQAGRIVSSQLTGEVGLVPENYLELVEAHPHVVEGEWPEEGHPAAQPAEGDADTGAASNKGDGSAVQKVEKTAEPRGEQDALPTAPTQTDGVAETAAVKA
ncbi:hypothetical protein Rhopal_002904-T1 [Rhodotorula paludigena]|uniref:SH3 domain-containing protein n=1 Tax=Rhodotorula paludigena TaxID=86838 RepID=A0AAV5GBK2_9BASI|nr:hypothetical protein Rhopal_002904-T1 [Rhodotorula paludigena]